MTCPNKSLPSWIKLNELTNDISYYIWNKTNGEIDDNGYPIKDPEVFQKILDKSDGDYKSAYLFYLSENRSIEEVQEESRQIEKQTLINMKEVKDAEEAETPLTNSETTLVAHLTKIDKMSEIRNKAIKALQVKLENQKKRFSPEDVERVEKYIDELSKLESEEALIKFTKEAKRVVDRYFKEYQTIKQQLKDIDESKSKLKKEDIFNPSILAKWRDYLAAYNVVEDFRNQLLEENKLYENKELRDIINDVIEKKNHIRDLYISKGKEFAAEFHAQHYDKLVNECRRLAQKKYSELSDSEKAKITEHEFTNAQVQFNKQDLHEQTVLMLQRELDKASKDIGDLGRWLYSIADSTDPVIISAYKAMAIASYRTINSFTELRDQTVDVLRDLEGFTKISNKKKLYDFMLEKDSNGNYTGKIVNRFGGKFWDDYQNVDPEKRREWLRSNTSFESEKFNAAKYEYLEELYKDGVGTENEINEIHSNDLSRVHLTLHEMAEDGTINDKLAELVSEWISSNTWNYRQPSEHYKKLNPQWKQLENILYSKDDPRGDFYNHYVDSIDKYNKQLPYNQRLGRYQIPSMLKTTEEKFADKDSLKSIAQDILSKKFDLLQDDADRTTSTITDEEGNIRHFIPVRFTGKLKKYTIKDKTGKVVKEFRNEDASNRFLNHKKNKDKGLTVSERETPEDQSYDLSTILLRFGHMSDDYKNKADIFPEMELTKFFINNREVVNTKSGIINTIKDKVSKKSTESIKGKNETNLASYFNDWYEMAMYGIKEKDQGTFFGLDVSKAANALNSFTSLNLLAVNVRAGINNVLVGEAFQTAEAFAGQHMTAKAYTKANKVYYQNIPGMMSDYGSRKPTNIVTKLYDYFGLPTESLNQNLKDNTRFKMLGKRSSLYFIMHAGDFYMQSRLFLGMLENTRAYNKEGEDIGSMLDMYQKHFKATKEMGLPEEVDLEKSNWTQKDRDNFTIKTRGIMSGIHGEYGELERNAIQRLALGRMAIMFRKFIVPGALKRYKKYEYSERIGDYTEGYYRSGAKFIANVGKEIGTLLFSIQSDKYELDSHQKANVIRAFGEVAFLMAAIILASVLLGKMKDDDDDKFIYSWAAYQLLRFKSEMLFFSPKIDEGLAILRSPMASMSMFGNISQTTHQLGVDLMGMIDGTGPEKYKKGMHKGEYKMQKVLYDWIPVARSIYSLINTPESLNLMNQSMVKKH